MAVTQALGSDAAAAGFNAYEHRSAQEPLIELLTIACAARGPPRDPVVLERA